MTLVNPSKLPFGCQTGEASDHSRKRKQILKAESSASLTSAVVLRLRRLRNEERSTKDAHSGCESCSKS
jgi:hypothetical protein